MDSRDMNLLFQVKMSSKQAKRAAAKASTECKAIVKTIQAAVEKGDMTVAERKTRLYLNKKGHADQLDEIADQMDQLESEIKTNMEMKKQADLMKRATKVTAVAARRMDPQQTIITTEHYREQNEAFSMNNRILQDAMRAGSSAQVNEDAVHEFLAKMTDAAGIQKSKELNEPVVSSAEPAAAEAASPNEVSAEADQALQERLRILRAEE